MNTFKMKCSPAMLKKVLARAEEIKKALPAATDKTLADVLIQAQHEVLNTVSL